MTEIKEFNRNDRVEIKSMCAWDIGFRSDYARKDIVVPGNATNYKLLTIDMVEEEILKQNFAFVGADGLGNHAAFKIVDPEVYKYLFRCEDKTVHFDKEALDDMLKLSTKTKFKDALDDMIVTRAEARMGLYYMNDIKWEDMLGWKHDILKAKCRDLLD